MKEPLNSFVGAILGYAAWELYVALRPDDLTEQMRDFMETAHGKFESYYAERRKRDGSSPPLGN